MSDEEDEVLPPRPLTPPQVDTSVFKNAAFGNLKVLKSLVDGSDAAAAEGDGADVESKGAEGQDAPAADDGGAGVDLNARDDYGNTALCWAARNGALESLEYLIGKGANIESAGYGGMRPLHFASNFAREKVVQVLLNNGADVDAKDEGGNTALHWYVCGDCNNLCTVNSNLGCAVDCQGRCEVRCCLGLVWLPRANSLLLTVLGVC